MTDRCPTCGIGLFARSTDTPTDRVRYCEPDWWAEQSRRQTVGEEVHPLARGWFTRR